MKDNEIVFKRKIYEKMLEWKRERNGSTALLIMGARRVGKSTIAEEFAQKEYNSYIQIDFGKVSNNVKELFNDVSDLDYLFLRLQFIFKVDLVNRKSVIIFDEIQKCPLARQAIKYLVEDGRYDYIETGSLLSIKKNVKDIVIPSEETKIEMFPMDFEEFKWAMGDFVTIPLLKQSFENETPLSDTVNRKILRDFRLYMLVGGMPQAVKEYLNTNNFKKVDMVKREIIELYKEDFRKIDGTGRSTLMFSAIPSQLSSNATRYKISNVIKGEKNERVLGIIEDMKDSKTINVAYNVNDPNVGFASTIDLEHYKMFVCDTGLFITLAFMDNSSTDNDIYNKLLNDKLSANLGYVYENMIAQILASKGEKLFYHTFKKDNDNRSYEIDFMVARNNKICPIEVKSSGYSNHASLDVFKTKFSKRIKKSYLVYTKDLKRDVDVLYIPIYMTMFI